MSCYCPGGCGRNIPYIFPHKGCHYVVYSCLWWSTTHITEDARPKIIDALLTLILRIEKILEFRGGLFNDAERKSTASEREFLAMTNAVEDRRYWTLHGKKVMFHVDHRALLSYTNKQLITPKIWRRMDHVLREIEIEIQYRPGKEMLADEFTRLTEDQSDGRYLGILLERRHFSDEAWEDIVRVGGGNSQDIYPSKRTGNDQEVLPEYAMHLPSGIGDHRA